ncbi:MAG TPA: GTPase Era [Burkholderiaceae bacterium]|jgi:GTP-binding protein Era|nr:GTPase Era [Burkholderiaceae bacterium]
MPEFRTGLIALIGRPNVGKSTLINALVGQKVSITSRKAQTTRHRVRGVLTRPDAQYVFVDTPGLQWERRSLLSDRMNAASAGLIGEVDVLALVIDARGWRDEDDRIVRLLPRVTDGLSHVVLIINKIDQMRDRNQLLPLIEASRDRYPFTDIVPVSAERGQQLEELLTVFRAQLPPGEPLFESDTLTDRSVRFIATELIREKAIRLLGDEIPYGLAVTIEQWTESEGRAVIGATVWVDRESHRGIVVGAGGGKLKEIGRLARLDIERLLEKPLHLDLWVKLSARWRDDPNRIARLGYGLRE